MNRIALPIAAVLLASGCAHRPPPAIPQAAEPVQVRCAPPAYGRCVTAVPRWEPADPASPDAWKLLLPQVVLPMGRELIECDQRVAALQACLDSLQRENVIDWR